METFNNLQYSQKIQESTTNNLDETTKICALYFSKFYLVQV